MKVFNAMFSKVLGGIEQSFLDYNQALAMQGFDVVAMVHPHAKVRPLLHSRYYTVKNFSRYDIFAAYKIKKIIRTEGHCCVISHSGRATALLRKAVTGGPLIAVSHNASFHSMIGVDAIIAVNSRMREAIIKAGQPEDTAYCVPNMIHLPQDLTFKPKPSSEIPVIGMIARFEPKKGIDVFIKSLALLKSKGTKFKAVIAGDGDIKAELVTLINKLGLKNDIDLLGWVLNKEDFYRRIDIFCLPSLVEPFGIVVLEAFMHSLPVIVTDTEGPLDIIADNRNGLIIRRNSPEMLMTAIEKLISDRELALKIAEGGYNRVQYYSTLNVSRMLKRTIETVCFKKLKL